MSTPPAKMFLPQSDAAKTDKPEKPEIKVVIFGFNGVLVDTVRMAYQAYGQVISKYGVALSFDEYKTFMDTSSTEKMAKLVAMKSPSALDLIPLAVLNQAKEDAYRELQEQGVPAIPEAIAALQQMIANKARNDVRIALVSKAPGLQVMRSLAKINLMTHMFDRVFCIEDMYGTTDISLYAVIAREFKVRPDQCLVFQSSAAAVQEAADAGMFARLADFKNPKFQPFPGLL